MVRGVVFVVVCRLGKSEVRWSRSEEWEVEKGSGDGEGLVRYSPNARNKKADDYSSLVPDGVVIVHHGIA